MGVSHTGFSTTAPWELNDSRTESAQQIQPWASLSPVLGISRFCDSGHVALRPSCCSVMVPTENTSSPEHHWGVLSPSSDGSQLYVCKLR